MSDDGMRNVFSEKERRVHMDLQHFAEGGTEGGAGGDPGNAGSETGTEGATGGNGGAAPMSFDDFLKDPKNQAEFDRRVNKALDTNKTKLKAEFETRMQEQKTEAEKMAKMNAEQKAQYAQEKKEKDIAAREAAITKRELTATAKEQLADKGLPISLASVLNYESAEACNSSIESVGKAFQEAVEKAVNDRLAGGKPMKKADEKAESYTMEQIKAMSPEEINKNWDAVQASMKNTN